MVITSQTYLPAVSLQMRQKERVRLLTISSECSTTFVSSTEIFNEPVIQLLMDPTVASRTLPRKHDYWSRESRS